jgi:hypothetical protein
MGAETREPIVDLTLHVCGTKTAMNQQGHTDGPNHRNYKKCEEKRLLYFHFAPAAKGKAKTYWIRGSFTETRAANCRRTCYY